VAPCGVPLRTTVSALRMRQLPRESAHAIRHAGTRQRERRDFVTRRNRRAPAAVGGASFAGRPRARGPRTLWFPVSIVRRTVDSFTKDRGISPRPVDHGSHREHSVFDCVRRPSPMGRAWRRSRTRSPSSGDITQSRCRDDRRDGEVRRRVRSEARALWLRRTDPRYGVSREGMGTRPESAGRGACPHGSRADWVFARWSGVSGAEPTSVNRLACAMAGRRAGIQAPAAGASPVASSTLTCSAKWQADQ
jgi:hypothetical protein